MKISLITPVYNRADCITGCLESVSKADKCGIEIEHVVCDDGSTDSTPAMVERYAAVHPHVRLLRLPRNGGPNTARNAAIRTATGKWLLFLDSDDTLHPDAFRRIARILADYPGYIHYLFTYTHRISAVSGFGVVREFDFNDFLTGDVSGDFCHLMLRTTALSLPFDERLRISEGIFFMRFYRRAVRMLFANEVLICCDRTRADHVTFTSRKTSRRALEETALRNTLFCEFFSSELRATASGQSLLRSQLEEAYRCLVLLSRYGDADEVERTMAAVGIHPSGMSRLCRALRCGGSAWILMRSLMRLRWTLRDRRLGRHRL